MIRGHGYLKYLKLSLIGFGISCFTVLGANSVSAVYCNSDYTYCYDLEYGQYINDGGYKGAVIDNNFNFRNYIFNFNIGTDTYASFWWENDALSYTNKNRDGWQGLHGKISGYFVCSNRPSLSNPRLEDYCTYIDNFDNFGSLLSDDNRYLYSCRHTESGLANPVQCSLCSYNSNGGDYTCFYNYSTYNNTEGFLSNNDINLLATNNPYSSNNGVINGGSYTGNFNTSTGNVVNYSCTKSQALQWYRCNGYKTRMCYSSYGNTNDLYTAPGVSQGYDLTGVDIEDVRFNTAWYRRNGQTGDSMSYKDWFAYWRKTFNVYKQNPQHTNPFLGVPVSIFTLMGNINSYGNPYTNESILEFCDLSLYTANYDNPYTGVAYNAVCSMSPIELIDCQSSNGLNPDDGYPGDGYTNGTVGPVGSSWDGITNRTGYHDKPGINTSGTIATGNDLNIFDDGSTFLNNFFNKLSDKFEYSNNNGVARLPSYIIVFLCAVILFKFLRK